MAYKKEGAAVSVNILPFRVYQILLAHTDGDHALPMGELLRLLRTEYGLRCDRRAVYAALDKLRAVGCHIPDIRMTARAIDCCPASWSRQRSSCCRMPYPPFPASPSASVSGFWKSWDGA